MNQIFKNPVFSIFIFIMFLLEFVAIRANADSVYVGAWSHHFSETPGLKNSNHNLIAYEHKGYIAGYLVNSFDDEVYIVGKRFELFEYGNFKSGIYLGATYGYYGCENQTDHATTCFAAVPEISYTKYKIQPSILILGNAAAISFKIDI